MASHETAIANTPNAEFTATALAKNLEETTRKRELMDRFIRENLKQGVDFAKPFRSAGKETLLKPGSEKVCVLLNLMPVFKAEEATLSHLPENVRSSTITFLCELVNRSTGVKIAEGRGSASLTEPNIKGNLNSAIKMAEKRAQMDATLRVAALSDRFTQDMEDRLHKQEISDSPTDLLAPTATDAIAPRQTTMLLRLWDELVARGVVEAEKSDATWRMTLQQLYGVTSSTALTKKQAHDFITRILARINRTKDSGNKPKKSLTHQNLAA